MKRFFRFLRMECFILIAYLLFPAAALAQTDWEEHSVYCPENRYGCLLLQMVMMGSFDGYDKEDALSVRILSAVYPQLCTLTEEDFEHFRKEYGEEEQEIKEEYYEALSDCLLANILSESAAVDGIKPEERVLLLFLDPEGETDAKEQMKEIREGMTEAVLGQMADAVGAPPEYVEWLIAKEQ